MDEAMTVITFPDQAAATYDGKPRLHRPSVFSAICRVCEGFLCIACGERLVDYPHALCGDCGGALARREVPLHGNWKNKS
jgi:hypothetical protein